MSGNQKYQEIPPVELNVLKPAADAKGCVDHEERGSNHSMID